MFNLSTKLTASLTVLGLGAMLLVGNLIVNHNKYKTTEVSLPSNLVSATVPVAATSGKKSITRLHLEANQVIFMNNEVNAVTVESAINKIQGAESSGISEIYIVLDCPGGSVFDGARLTSYMDSSTVKVNTVIYGLAASMCGHIFSHGKTRYMIDHSSTLMMHQASGGLQGSVKNMKNLLTYLDREVNRLDAYVADRSHLSRDEYDRLVSTDLWVSGEDAINMGLADKLAVINVDGGLVPDVSPLVGKGSKSYGEGILDTNPLKSFK